MSRQSKVMPLPTRRAHHETHHQAVSERTSDIAIEKGGKSLNPQEEGGSEYQESDKNQKIQYSGLKSASSHSDKVQGQQKTLGKHYSSHSQFSQVKLDGHVPAKVQSFYNALKKAEDKRLLICLKGYPDPDNIATSIALQWMGNIFKISSDIIYFEEISHHENRALVKKLDLELIQYSPGFDASSYDYYAVNDSQTPDLPIELNENCKLLIFVDHHKTLGRVQAEHVDIRENAGSTASIYGEYLMHSPLPFTGSNSEQNRVATALMHGIRTDTDNFVNAQPIDFQASQFFAKKIDRDLLALISRQSIPAKTMDLTQIALQSKDVKETFLFSGVGYVREEERDGIGQCADYLLNREGIETVIVYGIVGNTWIDGSLRTKSHVLDPDRWLKDVFGHDKEGQWYGGGRKDKGGFQLPLGVFSKCSEKDILWTLVSKTLAELFHEKIGFSSKNKRKDDHS
ncbi:MAG: bifunctional oligoribonuclease/PAP phosphatase NrnA [Proteobacteria bacterium]|nr:bifunctional oligoribonuclease/PAP phosphatase NrnA [Pseudomonadota bacterium]